MEIYVLDDEGLWGWTSSGDPDVEVQEQAEKFPDEIYFYATAEEVGF